jgi:hypothetical protein
MFNNSSDKGTSFGILSSKKEEEDVSFISEKLVSFTIGYGFSILSGIFFDAFNLS